MDASEVPARPFIVTFSGEWDVGSIAEMRSLLRPAYREAFVILDFTRATYLDSSALKQLSELEKYRVGKCGFEPTFIVTPDGPVRRLIELVRFDAVFPVFESLDAARRARVAPSKPSPNEFRRAHDKG